MKFLILLLALTGCHDDKRNIGDDARSGWERMIEDYTCSPEQWQIVLKRYSACSETSFRNSYCYASSIAAECTAKVKQDCPHAN